MEFIVNNVYLPLNKNESCLKEITCKMLKISEEHFVSFKVLKKAIDSRNKKRILFVYSLLVKLNFYYEHILINPNVRNNNLIEEINVPNVSSSKRPIIVGFGPSGMFSALILARSGLKPIVLERGKKVEERMEDISSLKNKGILNTQSNFCFGEGGAGTFSDGKLNTGVNDLKIKFVLNEFIKHGAPKEIYYQNHPHIGSDNLINVVRSIREEIISLGGEIRFNTTFLDYIEEDGILKGIKYLYEDKEEILECDDCILAFGHSARDTFVNLYNHKLVMKPKPFSLGVRIEHLQEDLDKAQYGKEYKNPKLPKSDYKIVVHLPNGRCVYSFCMCPGGEVVSTPTNENSIVTNGMSYYARDGRNCNAALLVNVMVEDYYVNSPLDGMYYQEIIEKEAFNKEQPYFAPCQRVGDFLQNRNSYYFGKVKPTYMPGTYFRKMDDVLPYFVVESLKEAFPILGKKLKIFKDSDAIITGIETRSSSPISIPRDENFNSSIKNLYPAGEGASYSGGIMSSALDGIKIALKIIEKYQGDLDASN